MAVSSLFESTSCTAVKVTVCAVSQFVGVNDSVLCRPVAAAVSTVTAAGSALATVTVTVPVGWPVSTAV